MKLTTLVSTLLLAGVLTAAPADKKTASPTEVKDPICGMTVDPKTAEKADYKGKTYYFCSREEKETFQKEPAKYVAEAKKTEKK